MHKDAPLARSLSLLLLWRWAGLSLALCCLQPVPKCGKRLHSCSLLMSGAHAGASPVLARRQLTAGVLLLESPRLAVHDLQRAQSGCCKPGQSEGQAFTPCLRSGLAVAQLNAPWQSAVACVL